MWVGWYILIFVVAGATLIVAIRNLAADKAKTRLDIIHSIIATAAIFVGAIWVWDQFSRERQGVPRLITSQTVTSFPIPEDQVLLNITTTLVNAGKTRVTVGQGFTRIQKVLPLDQNIDKIINPSRYNSVSSENEIREALIDNRSGAIPWPLMCKRIWDKELVIEPNESHDVNEQFLLPASTKLVRVYTYLFSPANEGLGYEIVRLHSLEEEGTQDVSSVEISNDRRLCNIDQPANQPGPRASE